MLTKITTPITFFKTFQTMRTRTTMERHDGWDHRTEKEFDGHRRHFLCPSKPYAKGSGKTLDSTLDQNPNRKPRIGPKPCSVAVDLTEKFRVKTWIIKNPNSNRDQTLAIDEENWIRFER